MRMYGYVVFAVILTITLTMFGFDTTSSYIINALNLNNATTGTGAIWVALARIFGAGAIAGVIVGSITRTSPTYIIKSGFVAGPLIALTADFFYILSNLNGNESWIYYIVLMLTGTLIGGYAIQLIKFWEGSE